MGADRIHPGIGAAGGKRERLLQHDRQARRRRGHCMSWRGRPRRETGEHRTGHGRGQRRRRSGRRLREHRRHLRRHGAMMRSVPPAAGRKARVVAAFEHPRQGPKPKEQYQKN